MGRGAREDHAFPGLGLAEGHCAWSMASVGPQRSFWPSLSSPRLVSLTIVELSLH